MKTITYTRRSLACQYFPDAEPEQAVRRLTSWIRRCRPLCPSHHGVPGRTLDGLSI